MTNRQDKKKWKSLTRTNWHSSNMSANSLHMLSFRCFAFVWVICPLEKSNTSSLQTQITLMNQQCKRLKIKTATIVCLPSLKYIATIFYRAASHCAVSVSLNLRGLSLDLYLGNFMITFTRGARWPSFEELADYLYLRSLMKTFTREAWWWPLPDEFHDDLYLRSLMKTFTWGAWWWPLLKQLDDDLYLRSLMMTVTWGASWWSCCFDKETR